MRLLQVAQHATDLERAAQFYSILLDRQPVASFDPPGIVFFELDGVRLLLEREAPTALHYLLTDGLDAAIERIRPHARILAEPHVIFTHLDGTLGPAGTEEMHAFIEDSEGNTVGLVEQRLT